jgi:protein O-mannosyl-transferase
VSSVGLQPGPQVQFRPDASSERATRTACGLGLLLVVLVFALYYPARTHPFVNYDDNLYVTDNEQVKEGLTWDTVTWAMTTYEAGNWHPLTWLSHAWDYQLYGMNPAGHHETSLLLHALNTVLVFWILLAATGYPGRSLMVAALFAVHPMNVEPVVWVAERKTVLSMTFFLLALGAYGWYAAKPRIDRYLLVAVLFALGLMAKPQVITFPFVLLLWDYWPLKRLALRPSLFAVRQSSRDVSGEERKAKSEKRFLLLEKLPLFAIAAASAALTMKAQQEGHAVLSLVSVPLSLRLSNAIVSYVRYLQKAFWPASLAPMYPHPGSSLHWWQVYGALTLLMAITWWAVEQRRRSYVLVGWLWFLGTLVPMIGLVQVGRQAMADRYAYLPLLGIFMLVCWGVADWISETRAPAALLSVLSVVLVLSLAIVARRQIGYWADNAVLWQHTIDVTPPNYIAQDNLGATLLARKRPEDAIGHFREAAALHPTDPISVFNIAVYEQEHGELRQAIERYRLAIVLTTRPSLKILALNNMGHAYGDLGDTDQARQCFDEARKLQLP